MIVIHDVSSPRSSSEHHNGEPAAEHGNDQGTAAAAGGEESEQEDWVELPGSSDSSNTVSAIDAEAPSSVKQAKQRASPAEGE